MKYICVVNGPCTAGKTICCYTCEEYTKCSPENKCIIPDGRDFVKCAEPQEDKEGD